MNGRNRPPQAYPRETITKAYEWLHKQTPATRELAQDMETLVSLFLQDQRLKERRRKKNDDSLQFKEELKNLAEGVKSFNGDPRNTPISASQVSQHSIDDSSGPFIETEPQIEPKALEPHTTASAPSLGSGFIDPKKYLQQHQNKLTAPAIENSVDISKISNSDNIKNMLQTTQNQLNLSTENEALNALISMGYEQIKKIFL